MRIHTRREAAKRMEPGASWWRPVTGAEAMGASTEELPSKHQETLFCREGDQALAQVVQEFVEAPSLEILRSHRHMELGHCLQVASEGPCQPQPSCDEG